MTITIVKPTLELRPFVKYFWTASGVDKPYHLFFYANANTKMIFSAGAKFAFLSNSDRNFSETFMMDNHMNNGLTQETFAGIIGASSQYSFIKIYVPMNITGVEFTETGAYNYLHHDLTSYSNKLTSIEHARCSNLSKLQDTMCCAASNCNERVIQLISHFSKNIQTNTRYNQDTDMVKEMLYAPYSSKHADIQTIANHYNTNERQICRIMHKYVGISLDETMRLRRFHEALKKIAVEQSAPLNDVALSCYYDQSHMNREFKKYCGHTPKTIKKHLASAATIYKSDDLTIKESKSGIITFL